MDLGALFHGPDSMRRFALVALAFGLLAGPATSQSGPDAEGLLNAVAYRPLPSARVLAVRTLDNSDQNLATQAEIERQLRAQGYTVRPDAPLVLTFEVNDEAGAWYDAGRRTIVEFQANEEGPDSAGQRVRVNIFDSAAGGVLNEGEARGTSIVTPTRFRIEFRIADRQTSERMWEAWAAADVGQRDRPQLTQAMLPALVASVGQTVRQQPFRLP